MLRNQFIAMVDIEVTHALLERHTYLLPVHVVLIAIDNRPDRLVFKRPSAREDTEYVHRVERLPPLAYQERGSAALHRCYTACRLRVARRYSVPDAPNIFPAFPSFTIEKRVLQIVRLVAIPAALNIYLMARLQPPISIHGRCKLEFVLPPSQDIPCKSFVRRSVFWFKGKRVAHFLCC